MQNIALYFWRNGVLMARILKLVGSIDHWDPIIILSIHISPSFQLQNVLMVPMVPHLRTKQLRRHRYTFSRLGNYRPQTPEPEATSQEDSTAKNMNVLSVIKD